MIQKLLLALALTLPLPEGALAQVQVQESTVRVHLSGRVQRPGVYTLPRGSRGVDAIQAAGGIAKGADLSELNLAGVLEDGERLHVPGPAETRSGPPGAQAPRPPRKPSAAKPLAQRPSERRISLNAATLEDLDSLPGIGRTLAEEVLRYRREKGRFRTLDELKEVPGIGERRFERLAPRLTL